MKCMKEQVICQIITNKSICSDLHSETVQGSRNSLHRSLPVHCPCQATKPAISGHSTSSLSPPPLFLAFLHCLWVSYSQLCAHVYGFYLTLLSSLLANTCTTSLPSVVISVLALSLSPWFSDRACGN
jgi:hypothetical protein